jgi:nicotinic acid mononucleotide adenylyltransferase
VGPTILRATRRRARRSAIDPTDILHGLRTSERARLLLWPEVDRRPASVALLAGSFDPVTSGHLAMAGAVRPQVDLVVLVYSVRTLPKARGAEPPLLGERERISTVAAACAERDGWSLGLCSHGLLADQVAAAAERFAEARLTVVLGSDKLAQLFDPAWYEDRDAELGALFAAADVRYAVREGDDVAGALAAAGELGLAGRVAPLPVDPAVAGVSSSAVRRLARSGGDVAGLVPVEALDAVRAAARREAREC